MKNVPLNGIRAATRLGVLMALTVSSQVQGAAAKPNIVAILADELGYAAVTPPGGNRACPMRLLGIGSETEKNHQDQKGTRA